MDPEPSRPRGARLKHSIPCVLERPGAEAEKAVLREIGFEGAAVESARPLAAGMEIRLTFTVPGTHLEDVPATVVSQASAGAAPRAELRFPEAWAGRLRDALLKPMKQAILVVEDDAAVAAQLQENLASAGYLVAVVDGVGPASRAFAERAFDLLIVDLTLPDGDGMAVLEGVRSQPGRSATPVLIMTADPSQERKLAGLAFGADHYLVKPVDPVELLFWVSALLRRAHHELAATGVLKFERGEIDPEAHLVRIEGREVANLRRKEFDLLYHLVAARPRVLSRRHILSKLWHTVATDNTVDVHIKNLRDRLGPEAAFRIVTVPGKGYKFI